MSNVAAIKKIVLKHAWAELGGSNSEKTAARTAGMVEIFATLNSLQQSDVWQIIFAIHKEAEIAGVFPTDFTYPAGMVDQMVETLRATHEKTSAL